jgi:hypothetical protein
MSSLFSLLKRTTERKVKLRKELISQKVYANNSANISKQGKTELPVL